MLTFDRERNSNSKAILHYLEFIIGASQILITVSHFNDVFITMVFKFSSFATDIPLKNKQCKATCGSTIKKNANQTIIIIVLNIYQSELATDQPISLDSEGNRYPQRFAPNLRREITRPGGGDPMIWVD